jgi:type II secretory ATPase GspE/PulE/Tfp pilus assembly ATPase PilB-like protein
MVGEIRDGETAEIAVRAALTGHLVFSTLHTNNAAGAAGRLMDMGVEPFLLSSVLEGVLAQRLGRRVCGACKQSVALDEAAVRRLGAHERQMFARGDGLGYAGVVGKGCERCGGTGMRGRLGFYELLLTNPAMRQAIARRGTMMDMMQTADKDFVTMRKDGLMKASEGMTTLDEVFRATQDAEEMPD